MLVTDLVVSVPAEPPEIVAEASPGEVCGSLGRRLPFRFWVLALEKLPFLLRGAESPGLPCARRRYAAAGGERGAAQELQNFQAAVSNIATQRQFSRGDGQRA